MTTEEFKIRYPQYSHLENDALWDKMTEVFINNEFREWQEKWSKNKKV